MHMLPFPKSDDSDMTMSLFCFLLLAYYIDFDIRISIAHNDTMHTAVRKTNSLHCKRNLDHCMHSIAFCRTPNKQKTAIAKFRPPPLRGNPSVRPSRVEHQEDACLAISSDVNAAAALDV